MVSFVRRWPFPKLTCCRLFSAESMYCEPQIETEREREPLNFESLSLKPELAEAVEVLLTVERVNAEWFLLRLHRPHLLRAHLLVCLPLMQLIPAEWDAFRGCFAVAMNAFDRRTCCFGQMYRQYFRHPSRRSLNRHYRPVLPAMYAMSNHRSLHSMLHRLNQPMQLHH